MKVSKKLQALSLLKNFVDSSSPKLNFSAFWLNLGFIFFKDSLLSTLYKFALIPWRPKIWRTRKFYHETRCFTQTKYIPIFNLTCLVFGQAVGKDPYLCNTVQYISQACTMYIVHISHHVRPPATNQRRSQSLGALLGIVNFFYIEIGGNEKKSLLCAKVSTVIK